LIVPEFGMDNGNLAAMAEDIPGNDKPLAFTRSQIIDT
jgi:hypothetical protein